MAKKGVLYFIAFHFVFILVSVFAILNEEYISLAITILFGYLVIISPNETWLESIPLVGCIASVANEIKNIHLKNWDLVEKYHQGNKLLKFFGTSSDKTVRVWRKELKRTVERNVSGIFIGSMAANISIGLIQYFVNPRVFWEIGILNKPTEISIFLFIAGIPLQIIWSIAMACFAMLSFLILQLLLEMNFEIKYKDSEYVTFL
jgi:hypothetical protein